MSPTVIKTAVGCLEETSLRILEALHLASAKESYYDVSG